MKSIRSVFLLFLILVGVVCVIVMSMPEGRRAVKRLSGVSSIPASTDLDEIRARVIPQLSSRLLSDDLKLGSKVFIRIFKETSELELWLAGDDGYKLVKNYPICNYSGDLGPKLKEGDRQAPEGVYQVSANQLNPNSRYHLSFNLGFPNEYDRGHKRTGSFLMIHGNCLSIGCYAMTDPVIEEIYLMVEQALAFGQEAVKVHIFPFRMNDERLAKTKDDQWHDFWMSLKPIHDAFETSKKVPIVEVKNGRYSLM